MEIDELKHEILTDNEIEKELKMYVYRRLYFPISNFTMNDFSHD